ncbi:MAG: hypothetical protein ACRDPZ_00225 [Gaiellaceae bacterium]
MKRVPWFLAAALLCALVSVGGSLWWSYGGESTGAALVTYAALGVAGLLAFAGGVRGELRRWHASPRLQGLYPALLVLGATFAAILVANFRTESGASAESTQVTTTASEAPLTPHQRVLELVETAAREEQEAAVLAVVCPPTVNAGEIGLSTCAVTFVGPSCQLWMVINTDGQDKVLPFSGPSQDRRASYDEMSGMTRCIATS